MIQDETYQSFPTEVPVEVPIEIIQLGKNAIRIYSLLRDLSKGETKVTVSTRVISLMVGLPEKTVRERIHVLTDAGIIIKHRRQSNDEHSGPYQLANEYEFLRAS